MILVAWLGLLFSTIGIAASDFFCIDLSTIATILGMSESMAGVTFLAFGNGSPDVFSTFAAMSTNSSSLAIGELIGAAGFITAVVAGSMALVRPFKVAKKSFIRDVGFFVVAASFSMVFLADGRLHLWECIAMVAFYIFYVVVVVVWHWVLTRRLKRREREAKARGHFVTPGNEEIAVQEEYHDDENAGETSSRPAASRGVSAESFSWLERGNVPRIEEPEEDDDEEARDRWLGELNTNMRISRPNRGRRNTITPVRPSLVGALEFQSVLTQLNKQRNIQRIPLSTRRFSDDPNYTTAQQQEAISPALSSSEDPLRHTEVSDQYGEPQRPTLDKRTATGSRARAVSVNDAAALRVDPAFLQKHGQQVPTLVDIAEDDESNTKPQSSSGPPSPQETRTNRSLSPATHETILASTSNMLAPPTEGMPDGFRNYTPTEHTEHGLSPAQSPKSTPRHLRLRIPSASRSPLSRSPMNSSPSSPFPEYRDDPFSIRDELPSLYLPAPSASVDGQLYSDDDEADEEKPIWWWPNRILPSPWVLMATLFPTLYHWREKSWWERSLAIVAAPSVFLLTITLPVVEAERNEDELGDPELQFDNMPPNSNQTKTITGSPAVASPAALTSQSESSKGTDAVNNPLSDSLGNGSAGVAARAEQQNSNMPAKSSPLPSGPVSQQPTIHSHSKPVPKLWNRWLTIVQLFLAPILIVLIIYTQYLAPDDPSELPRLLLKPMLIALLTSIILLIPLLLTTTPTHRPRIYETILSLLGFTVSIAWISTIASQVVAVLKSLAVILNMSHAILGLTIFAVGNSLGDLVADITVARLGYPVMALSACFGGPMLNILLGIGLSGSWILIRGAEHRHHKHPDRPVKFRTYDIEVSETLVVSGVGLLVTLIGLLVAVPWNRWMMTRGIAFALIGVWVAFTVTNVVLEVVGVGEKKAAG